MKPWVLLVGIFVCTGFGVMFLNHSYIAAALVLTFMFGSALAAKQEMERK